MGNTILTEAVDDVRALKQAAEESAKALFIESVSPRIDKMIKSKLNEDADAPSQSPEIPDFKTAEHDVDHDADADQDDLDVDDVDGDEDDDVEIDVDPDEEDEDEEEVDTMEVDDDDTEDEEELDEAKEDDDDGSEDDDDDDSVDNKKEAKMVGTKTPDKKIGNLLKKVKGSKSKKMKAKGCEESVEVTPEDLKAAFVDVLRSGIKEDSALKKFKDPQDPNDGEYGLPHKVPGEVAWADGKKVIKKAKSAKMITKEAHARTVKKLCNEIARYQEALRYYKKNLVEMNVFNAKLLYTAQLLQNNLTTKQRKTVVESIDNAKTKKEVELVFQTLSESLKIAGSMNESRRVSKGNSSRYAAPSSTLTEGKQTQSDRWAVLAGVKD